MPSIKAAVIRGNSTEEGHESFSGKLEIHSAEREDSDTFTILH